MTQSEASTLAYQVSEHTGVRYVAQKVSEGWTITPRAVAVAAALVLSKRMRQDEAQRATAN